MDTFIGFISPFPYTFAPANWSMCHGQLLAISQYNALFALLGTNYGGNGTTTFGLPDLQGRQAIGAGRSSASGTTYMLAAMGGMESVTLSPTQAPLAAHTHNASFTPSTNAQVQVSTNPTASVPVAENGSYLGSQKSLGGLNIFVPPTPAPTETVALGGVSGGGGTVTVQPNSGTSAAVPVELMNPYLALNFCIAMMGIFPSRN